MIVSRLAPILVVVACIGAPSALQVSGAVLIPPLPPQVPTPAREGEAAPGEADPRAWFRFDGGMQSTGREPGRAISSGQVAFVDGITGRALRLGSGSGTLATLPANLGMSDVRGDFSVRFWVRSEAGPDRRFVLVSQKEFHDNGLPSQKNPGWVFYHSDGTWAWNVGSGSRRLMYERENGVRMPLNDGRWHQLAMTYSVGRAEVRLYYDGVNWASYHVGDADSFDFASHRPITVGWDSPGLTPEPDLLPAIERGAGRLQAFVDAFNALVDRPVESDELLRAIVDPRALYSERTGREPADSDWAPVAAAEAALMDNPYTIHQALEFMEAAPLRRIYALVDGRVAIRRDVAARYADRERLSPPEFDIDDLTIWDRALSAEEVRQSFEERGGTTEPALVDHRSTLTAAAWNIWHGGKHFTTEEHGWDSRIRVADMIREEGVDVVMMQETYSSGDFIAAELGYYFATTVDRDYLNQGANISVLSRYPITEIHVQEDSPFQNVGAKVALSETQDVYVMSNWYGMNQFGAVFDFHQGRFAESDSIPVLFGGDFNAVPHTDGGDSPASIALMGAGFTDAFRSLHPDVAEWPGPTHRGGRRIDQLYYKGAGLRNTSTRVIYTRSRGFPSDHYLIVSRFALDYRTRGSAEPR